MQRNESKTRKAIIIKGSGGGGLGDRIRAVLVGMLYAELSGRSVYIDWRDGVYGPKGLNVFTELFNVKELPVLPTAPEKSSTKPSAWAGRINSSMDEIWNRDGNKKWERLDAIESYSFDLGDIDHTEEVVVMWDFDQLDALREHLPREQASLDSEALLALAYQRFLSPAEELEREVANCFRDITGMTVGVHVRASREGTRQKGVIPLKAYFRAIDSILGKNDVERIVVSTDSKTVEEEIKNRYGSAWARQKWFADPGESLHLNDSCPDKLQAAKDAVVDMLLLARCDRLVSAQNSSFSMLARLMSSAPSHHKVRLSPQISLKTRLGNKLRARVVGKP